MYKWRVLPHAEGATDWKSHCLEQVARSPLRTDPFPHLVVEPFVPPAFYASLLRAFPDRSSFRKARYAGAGLHRRAAHYQDHGLVMPDEALPPPFAELTAFLQSEPFARALLARLSTPLADGRVPLPPGKHASFAHGARDFHSRAHLHIDLAGYEIPPHPDSPDKLVTFQMYLSKDAAIRQFGTHFLRPLNGRETVAHRRYLGLRRLFNGTVRLLGLSDAAPIRRLRESAFGVRTGLLSPAWFPWEWFETVAMAEALPNHFMAFAPGANTYHAVRLDFGPDHPSPERRVIRGFVRQGVAVFERVKML